MTKKAAAQTADLLGDQPQVDVVPPKPRKSEQAVAMVKAEPAQPITALALIDKALSTGASIEMLDKLMALQERFEANEARKAFFRDLAAFKAETPTITKNKQVKFESRRTGGKTDFWHATLDNCVRVLGPVLSKHNFSYRWRTEQIEGGNVRIVFVLSHILGHSEETSLSGPPDDSGHKNRSQQTASTATMLARHTMLMGTGMATVDQDDDAGGPKEPEEFISAEQIVDLETRIDAISNGATQEGIASFCKYMGVAKLGEIYVSEMPKAFQEIEAAAKRRKTK